MRRSNARHQASPARAMVAAMTIVALLTIGFVFNARRPRARKAPILDRDVEYNSESKNANIARNIESAMSHESEHDDVKLAFILTEGLHGSTWLVSLLNEHPQIALGYELLKREKNKAADRLVNALSWSTEDAAQFYDSEDLFRKALTDIIDLQISISKKSLSEEGDKDGRTLISGFKVHHGHVKRWYQVFVDTILERNATIIHLTRRNTLEAWISMLISTVRAISCCIVVLTSSIF